ncbi:MAG: nidogen-like domain-containing protein [Polyangiales bacterium]
MTTLQKFTFAAFAALASVPLLAGDAGAIPLLTGFGGPSGYGLPENCVHPNDDGSYAGPPPTTGYPAVAVSITRAFPMGLRFFGTTYNTMYVNTNGNITFRGAVGTYTPSPFPIADQPMIAPWWADVDTRGGGQPMRNNICFHVEPNRVVVTWNNVGYFSSHDDRQNDFQLVLTTSNTCSTTGDFDVEFRYNRCQWTTGDASGGTGGLGGTPAQVGFDAGNRRNYVALPMSRMMSILDVCRTSNVPGGAPGLWRFQIRGGDVAGGCMGGGTACTVAGQMGACGQGVNVCEAMGTRCAQVNMPRDERCNGNDDNCNGMIDEGDNLCPMNYVCDRGSCVERCSGELGCVAGRTCTEEAGICVENTCMDVTCPAGQRCVSGSCVGVCDGVTCPVGQVCRAGRCLNPCEGVTCNPMEVCDRNPGPTAGLCVPGCQCTPCPMGQMCQPDGYCVSDDCAGVTCPTGEYCRGGMCRDACETGPDTRLCPSGEVCQAGDCVTQAMMPRPDAGVGDGGADGGRADGGRTDSGLPPVDVMIGVDGGNGGPDADEPPVVLPPSRRGCQCSTVGAESTADARLAALGLAAAVAAVARRRRR